MANGFRQRWRCYKCLSGNRVRTSTASSAYGESRRLSAVPSIPQTKLNSSIFEVTSGKRTALSPSLAAKTSPEPVSSFALPDRSSQPHQEHPDQLTRLALPVVDTDLAFITAKHGTLSHSKDSSRLNRSTVKILHRSNENGPSQFVEQTEVPHHEPVSSEPLYASYRARVEVLNTPTQRSDEFDTSGSRSVPRAKIEAETKVNDDDDSQAVDQPPTGNIAMLIVLCASCRTRRVFAKNQGGDIPW